MDSTGAARGTATGGEANTNAPPPPPPQPPTSYPLDILGRVRTLVDLAALITAGSDEMAIKTEICGYNDEPMEEEDNEVICIVNLDERNNIVDMEDPFGGDSYYADDDCGTGTEGEELLEETGGSGNEDTDEGEREEDSGVAIEATDGREPGDGPGGTGENGEQVPDPENGTGNETAPHPGPWRSLEGRTRLEVRTVWKMEGRYRWRWRGSRYCR
jgi:hypothetical protein